MLRQVVLDTETTGIEPELGHRIIEIGCVELVNRRLTGRVYHEYLQPDREIDQGAYEVHGISNEFLADKPRFADISDGFIEFIKDSDLVIHNAAFDVGFLDAEFARLKGAPRIKDLCHNGAATDSLAMARKKRPGQRNSLDALCKAYGIDNSNRELHGALLDARLLAEVYLSMTREQNTLLASSGSQQNQSIQAEAIRRVVGRTQGPSYAVLDEEAQGFNALIEAVRKSGDKALWDEH